jgi:hypothetical protein
MTARDETGDDTGRLVENQIEGAFTPGAKACMGYAEFMYRLKAVPFR